MKLAKILVALLLCALLLVISSCGQRYSKDQSSYWLYRHTYFDTSSTALILEKQVWEIDDNASIKFEVGIGRTLHRGYTSSSAVLTISAPGCTINGSQDTWSKDFSDYYSNETYSIEEKPQKLFFLRPLCIPNYHESIEITVPQGENTGTITITLTSTLVEENNKIITEECDFHYMKNDSKLVFYDVDNEFFMNAYSYVDPEQFSYQSAKELLEE